MRVAFIVTEFPKTTETFTLREIAQMRRKGHDVRIFYLTRFQNRQVQHDFAAELMPLAFGAPYLLDKRVVGASLRSVGRKPGSVLSALSAIVRNYWKHPVLLTKSLALLPKMTWMAQEIAGWKADHVHATFAGHPGTCAWLVERLTGTPFSMSCHAHDIFRTQAMLGEKISRAAFVRPISLYNQEFIRRKVPGVDGAKLHVVHCGVDTQALRKSERAPGEQFRILYVGSLQVRKGVDTLLRAMTELSDARCQIIGDGPQRAELEQLSRSLKLENVVTFSGAQPFERIGRTFDESDVLVVPSILGPGGRAEGIPTVIMEALAHEVPVVASNLTGVPEIIRDRETGYLVDPGDSAQLASTLRLIAEDGATASACAVRGRQLVCAEFDLSTNVAALERLMALSLRTPAGVAA
jgi:glycosyltransferase involved in cell wall biosynthesis